MKNRKVPSFLMAMLLVCLLAGCKNAGEAQVPDGAEIPAFMVEAPAPAQTAAPASNEGDVPFSFTDLLNLEFWFGSGSGGWCTVLTVHHDGTFEGNYQDADFDSMWLCDFTGKFSEPVKVNDYTYSVTLEQIELEQEPDTEEIRGGIKITYSTPYGLDDAEELLFYLPGAPVEELPEGYQSWMRSYGDCIGTELPFFGLYNVSGEQGYTSHISEELRALNKSAQAAYADLLAGDFSLLEGTQRHPCFTAHSGEWEYATMDLDGDGVSELLVQGIDAPWSYNAVFHYSDGKVTCWNNDDMETSCRDYPLQDGTMVRQYDAGTAANRYSHLYTLFYYQPGGETIERSSMSIHEDTYYDGTAPSVVYMIDTEEVDKAAFDAQFEELIGSQLLDRSAWTKI